MLGRLLAGALFGLGIALLYGLLYALLQMEQNALVIGSVMLCLIAMAIALTFGILAGTWLAEYAGASRYGGVVRFLNDVLLSAPSILIGLFVWEVMVAHLLHHFSGYAGSVALALIAVPLLALFPALALLIAGQAAHAGSTPMAMRQDSLAAAARSALAIRESAITHGGVGTVGRMDSAPGVITAVAGRTEMQLDQRHLDARALAAMLDDATGIWFFLISSRSTPSRASRSSPA